MNNIDNILYKLSLSKFRSSFHLKEKDKLYIKEKGVRQIISHGYDFIDKRLRSKNIENDGKQTPMRGHPIFIAQHACACCCRGCLEKWHKIDKNHDLTNDEIKYILEVLITWLRKEYYRK